MRDRRLTKKGEMHLDLVQTLSDGAHEDTVWDINWSPDGNYLASCGTDKAVKIWAFKDGLLTFTNYPESSLSCVAALEEGHKRTIRSIAWSPDSKILASASFDSTICIWERSEENGYEAIASLEGHENEVKYVSFSPSGKYLATSGRDKTIWIWEIDCEMEFECSGIINSHTQDVKKVCWHPTLDILVSSSYDDTIRIHSYMPESMDWETIQTLYGHNGTVWSAKFAPSYVTPSDQLISQTSNYNNQLLWLLMASVSSDQNLKIWANGTINHSNVDNSSPQSLTDSIILKPWKCVSTAYKLHSRPMYDLDWHPKIPYLVATCGGDNAIRLTQIIHNNNETHLSTDKDQQNSLNENPNIKCNEKAYSNQTNIKNSDITPQKKFTIKMQYEILDAHTSDINAIRWNPVKPLYLASCSDDSTIKIWKLSIP